MRTDCRADYAGISAEAWLLRLQGKYVISNMPGGTASFESLTLSRLNERELLFPATHDGFTQPDFFHTLEQDSSLLHDP